jgi:hypothetical protein
MYRARRWALPMHNLNFADDEKILGTPQKHLPRPHCGLSTPDPYGAFRLHPEVGGSLPSTVQSFPSAWKFLEIAGGTEISYPCANFAVAPPFHPADVPPPRELLHGLAPISKSKRDQQLNHKLHCCSGEKPSRPEQVIPPIVSWNAEWEESSTYNTDPRRSLRIRLHSILGR